MTATVYARGVNKIVTVATETTFGTQASGSGQQLRRIQSDLNLIVTPISSQEILPSQQVRDARHGPFQVQGTLSGQLSPLTYETFFAILLRSSFAAGGVQTAALTDTVISGVSGSAATLGTTVGNFLTDGFKVGDIIRLAGNTGADATDSGNNARVTSVTATAMNLQFLGAPVAYASGQSVTISTPGKKCFIPATGQAINSVSIEHWYGDVGVSELFLGVMVNQISINIPAAGFVTFQASMIGQSMTVGSAQVYGSPTAPTTTTSLTAVGGRVYYQGNVILVITSANLQIAAAAQADPVVGSNQVPAIFMGTLSVRGSFTALFPNQNDTMMNDFLVENEVDLSFLMTTSPANNSDFVHVYLPRCKLMAATKTDSDRAISRSFQFMALENFGSNANANLTTVMVQDSLAV